MNRDLAELLVDKNLGVAKTVSGKNVWLNHKCGLTGRYHGLYLSRNNVWIATSWGKDGSWLEATDSSMDLVL